MREEKMSFVILNKDNFYKSESSAEEPKAPQQRSWKLAAEPLQTSLHGQSGWLWSLCQGYCASVRQSQDLGHLVVTKIVTEQGLIAQHA